jgi:hypothetical protein
LETFQLVSVSWPAHTVKQGMLSVITVCVPDKQ